jgi:hypothetical protein
LVFLSLSITFNASINVVQFNGLPPIPTHNVCLRLTSVAYYTAS